MDQPRLNESIIVRMDSAQFIGYYRMAGPTGYIESKYQADVLRFANKLIRSWPNAIAKKPYRDRHGNWIVKVKTK